MERSASRSLLFLSELKRRHVFRMAIAYMVGAWIMIEATDTIFPLLQLPEWGAPMVVALAVAGFPIALLLSWAYDLTPPGVVRAGRARAEVEGKSAAAGPPPHPAPASTLMGRDREMEELTALLAHNRLVTVTGPGGMGKTRLALEVLHRLYERDLEGRWLVELAGLQDPELIASTVAAALGVVPPSDQTVLQTLISVMGRRRGLLLLDNCEHLTAAVAEFVATLGPRCPGLRILATSREALQVAGECTYRLAPLPVTVPGPDGATADGDAMRLFEARATAVLPGFRITPENRSAVRAICTRVDGLPLALELSAARLRMLSPTQLAARLEQSFDLVSGARRDLPRRHQAMGATIDWSVNLLHPAERQLFLELSVFRGGFELDAVEAVATSRHGAVLDLFGNLIDKSLVTVDGDSDPRRYRLLEALRQYGWSHLSPPEVAELQGRHLAWCAELAETADGRLTGPEATAWLNRLGGERDNLRSAMGVALSQGSVVDALRIAGGLSWFWFRLGHVAEGRLWLDRVMAATGDTVHAPLSRVLLGLSGIQYLEGDFAAAAANLDRAMEMAARFGQDRIRGRALVNVAYIRAAAGELDAAERAAVEGQELARAGGHRDVETEAFTALGQIARARGELREAEDLLLEGVAGAREIGHHWQASSALWVAAKVALDRGDPRTAEERLRLSIGLMWSEGDRTSTLVGLHTLAGALAATGNSRRAATLLGAVAAAGEGIGYSPERMDPLDAAATVARVQQSLDPASYTRAFHEGLGLTLATAVDLASPTQG